MEGSNGATVGKSGSLVEAMELLGLKAKNLAPGFLFRRVVLVPLCLSWSSMSRCMRRMGCLSHSVLEKQGSYYPALFRMACTLL